MPNTKLGSDNDPTGKDQICFDEHVEIPEEQYIDKGIDVTQESSNRPRSPRTVEMHQIQSTIPAKMITIAGLSFSKKVNRNNRN